MADDNKETKVGSKLETEGTAMISPSEGTTLPITGHKLNSQNYTQWARSVRIFLQGKREEEYVTSDAKQREKDGADLEK